jgi:hypothetical protein
MYNEREYFGVARLSERASLTKQQGPVVYVTPCVDWAILTEITSAEVGTSAN